MSYRRFVRIAGELISSPRFTNKKDAEDWYQQMRRKKQFLRDGLMFKDDGDKLKFISFARVWMKRRIAGYPKSTWAADEQRLRDYILPILSEMPIQDITPVQVRNLLLEVSKEGFLREGFKISPPTRTRIKSLLSSIFSDALNEDPPLVPFNPVSGLKIKEKRVGIKKPKVLPDTESCILFLETAKVMGIVPYTICSTFLMSGLRKQELIALRWKSIDFKNFEITVSEKLVQASNRIEKGTKAGEQVTRVVPIPKVLAHILQDYQTEVKGSDPERFVFERKGGEFMSPRMIYNVVLNVAGEAGLSASPHALRHTFGREFARNTGNMKVLQAILGHSSSITTDIYAELSGQRIKGFSESVSFDLSSESKKR